jgi:hypothetical protein
MADLDTQIRESQAQVREAQARISEITSRIERRAADGQGTEVGLDIENATLQDVHKHTEVMNANIAELIMGPRRRHRRLLQGLPGDAQQDGWETLCRLLQRVESEAMRQERMRLATIDDKLQDLIAKSDTIVKLLEGSSPCWRSRRRGWRATSRRR